MNVLFLDDNPVRRKMFRSEVPYAKIVETSAECINALCDSLCQDDEDFDFVLLDHDLGGEIYVDSNREDTGMEVVRWIVENKPVIGKIIVHSHNVPASNRMVRALKNAGYKTSQIPFRYKMDQELK